MTKPNLTLFISLIFILATSALHAQEQVASKRLIQGKVVDAQTGAPIAKANIVCETPDSIGTARSPECSGQRGTASDDDGSFALRLSTLPTFREGFSRMSGTSMY